MAPDVDGPGSSDAIASAKRKPKIRWVRSAEGSSNANRKQFAFTADHAKRHFCVLGGPARRTWPWKTSFAEAIASEDPGPSTEGAVCDR